MANRLMSVMSRKLAVPAGLSVVILYAATGCARPVNRTAERKIREALPAILGGARSYQVRVDGNPVSTARGRLGRVQIDAIDLQLKSGLLLDHLYLDLRGVDYDEGRHDLRGIRSAQFQAAVGEKSLNEFLAGAAPPGENLRDVTVSLVPGNHVTIRGERVTLGVGVPFAIGSRLRIAGPARIELDPNTLSVAGIPIGSVVLPFLRGQLEQAVDLSNLPFAIHLTMVGTSAGQLQLAGTASALTSSAR